MDKFDEMVEALEENEDLVECQECFDLFPKADCQRQEHGYICPTCKRGFETKAFDSELSQYALTNDLYSQDFPDITEYDSESIHDTRNEPTVSDALNDLIADEYEAIDGYEVADEIIQHSDLDSEEKDDILDTIEHIKEEEEEHIDELEELKDEDDDYEDSDDDKVAEGELLEEGVPSPAGIGEGDELLEDEVLTEADFKSSSADAGKLRRGANKTQNKVRQWHHKFTKAGLNLNTLADGKNFIFYFESSSAKQAAANINGRDMREVRYNDLAEAQKNAKSVSFAIKDYVTVVLKKSDLSIVDPAVTKFLEDFSTGSGNAYYEITVYNNGQRIKDNTKEINNGLKKLSVAASNLSGGRSAEEGAEIDALRDRLIKEVLGPRVDSAPYTAASYGEYTKAYNEIVKQLQAASSKEALEEIDIELLKKAAEEKLEKKPEQNQLALEALRDELVDMFGDKKDPEPYTEQSYAKYSERFDKNLNAVKEAKQESTLKLYKEQLPELIKSINAVLVLKDGSSEEGGEENTTPNLEEAKKKAKDLLGEKLAKEKYTPESYEEYSKLFDAIVSDIDAADTVDKLKAINVEERKKAAEAKLKLAENSEEEEELDIPDEEDMEALKKAALDALGEKEPADPYTEESYAAYSAKYDTAVKYINKQTTKEGLDRFNYAKLAAKYKKLLEKKTEEDIPEEEEETPNLDEAKAEAKKLLGDKLPEDEYTPESYKEYSEAFDKIVADIDAASTMEELKAINVEERKAEAEKLLVKKTAEEEEPSDAEDLDKLKAELADKIMDQGTTTEDREKYTEESCNEFDAAIEALVEELEPIDTIEAFREFESKVDGRIEELRKKLVLRDAGGTDENEEDTDEDDKLKGKLKYTNKGIPRENLGEMDSDEYKSWGFPKQAVNAYATPVRREWQELVGLMKELVVSSGAKHSGDLKLLTKKLGNFLNKQHKSEFVFEAFRRKFMRECASSEVNREMLSESLTKIFKEEYAADSVTCAWCDKEYPSSMCRQEIDLGWLCEQCEQAIKSRGEELTFTEDLKTTGDAVKELKDTEAALKSAADGMKNMTDAMKEDIDTETKDLTEALGYDCPRLREAETNKPGVAKYKILFYFRRQEDVRGEFGDCPYLTDFTATAKFKGLPLRDSMGSSYGIIEDFTLSDAGEVVLITTAGKEITLRQALKIASRGTDKFSDTRKVLLALKAAAEEAEKTLNVKTVRNLRVRNALNALSTEIAEELKDAIIRIEFWIPAHGAYSADDLLDIDDSASEFQAERAAEKINKIHDDFYALNFVRNHGQDMEDTGMLKDREPAENVNWILSSWGAVGKIYFNCPISALSKEAQKIIENAKLTSDPLHKSAKVVDCYRLATELIQYFDGNPWFYEETSAEAEVTDAEIDDMFAVFN